MFEQALRLEPGTGTRLFLRMHALTGPSQMTPQGAHVAALVEQDPALAVSDRICERSSRRRSRCYSHRRRPRSLAVVFRETSCLTRVTSGAISPVVAW